MRKKEKRCREEMSRKKRRICGSRMKEDSLCVYLFRCKYRAYSTYYKSACPPQENNLEWDGGGGRVSNSRSLPQIPIAGNLSNTKNSGKVFNKFALLCSIGADAPLPFVQYDKGEA